MQQQPTTKPKSRVNKSDVVFTELENEGVILNLKTKYYFTTNEVGVRIWQLLESGSSEATIIQTLLEEYDIDEPTLRQDVTEILTHLKKEQLIV